MATETDDLSLNGQVVAEIKKVDAGADTTTWLHPDLLGSPRKATDDSGNVVWSEHDDPLVGKFPSTDPVNFTEGIPLTFNRYAYANNNPYRYIDPTGMSPELEFDNKPPPTLGERFIQQQRQSANGGVTAAGIGVQPFATLDDVREAIYGWMIEYNEERNHHSLGDLTPIEYQTQFAGNSTFELLP